jgi:hypothetical protein
MLKVNLVHSDPMTAADVKNCGFCFMTGFWKILDGQQNQNFEAHGSNGA